MALPGHTQITLREVASSKEPIDALPCQPLRQSISVTPVVPLEDNPAGELFAALCAAFEDRPAGIELNSFGTGSCYTRLSHHGRSAQVFTGLGSRDFRLDFSECGSMVAKGRTWQFDHAVEALTTWLAGTSTVEGLIAQHRACEIRRPQDFTA